jgi:hypothetical protein
MELTLTFDTSQSLQYQLELLEIQDFEEPVLTYIEDNSISHITGYYGIEITAKNNNPIIKNAVFYINCVGQIFDFS